MQLSTMCKAILWLARNFHHGNKLKNTLPTLFSASTAIVKLLKVNACDCSIKNTRNSSYLIWWFFQKFFQICLVYLGQIAPSCKRFSQQINWFVSMWHCARKIKFFITDLSSKCDQTCRKLRIWSHLLKKSLMGDFIFCAMWWED